MGRNAKKGKEMKHGEGRESERKDGKERNREGR